MEHVGHPGNGHIRSTVMNFAVTKCSSFTESFNKSSLTGEAIFWGRMSTPPRLNFRGILWKND